MLVAYKWTKERFLEANKANYDLKFKTFKTRSLGYIGIIFVIFGSYLAYTKGVYAMLAVSILFVVYWFFLRWPLYRLQLKFNFNKHTSKDKTISWSIEQDTFTVKSDSGEGSYKWDAITDISESSTGFLIRQYPVFYWLPKDCFESPNDISWFRETVVKNVGTNK